MTNKSEKKKNIAIDAHMLGDCSGGNESYYRNLINHFIVDGQINLIILVQPEYDIRKITVDCEIVRFKSHNALVRNFIEIPRMVHDYKIDVLHMQYFIPFSVSCKVIVTIHDISFEHFKNIFTKKDYITQKILIPYAAKHSDMIFTVSEFSKKDIVERYHVPEKKVVVTYNGAADVYVELSSNLDDSRVQLQQKKCMEVHEKYGLVSPYILSVGNLQPRKNLRRLISAYAMFVEGTQADIQLVIVGKKAWMYEELFGEIENSVLKDRITLTDYVEEDDLVWLYHEALFFVYPSYFEGFGIPVLEAMCCKTPVATSNCTSLPEVAGDAGILFDPYDVTDIYDKIKRLYQSLELREELVQKGIKRAKMFTWDDTAEKVMRIYSSL